MRVGYRMRREIEALFPCGTTSGERLAALAIADTARRETRISLATPAELSARTGLSEDGLKKALQRLRKRGLDFRVSHGKGSDGRDVYTIPGSGMEYRVPSTDEFMAASGPFAAPFKGGTTVPPNGRHGPVDKPP